MSSRARYMETDPDLSLVPRYSFLLFAGAISSSTMASSSDEPAATGLSMRAFHILKIDGYSTTLNTPYKVSCFRSCPFRVGGRTWQMSYYPKGSRQKNTDSISVFLILADADAGEPVTAQATFDLLDQDQKPVPRYERTIPVRNFSASDPSRGYEWFMRREELEKSEHLIDDCFAIRVDVEVLNKEAPSMAVPPSDMHRHIGNLLSSEEGADLEFRVGGDTFPAHRLVLSARSPVFRAQLFDLMKEGTANVIHVDDMEAPAFRALLRFIYTDTLAEIDPKDEYATIQQLLVAADKYGLRRLKVICEDRLCDHVSKSSVAAILLLAEKYHCSCLKEACFEFLSSPKVLFEVIETEEFSDLAQSVPAVTRELTANFLTRCLEKASISLPNSTRCVQDSQISMTTSPGQSSSKNGSNIVGFRVGEGSNTTETEHMEAQVFRDFLTFICTSTLQEVDPKDEYAIAQHLLVVADKHGLERLRLICGDILGDHIKTSSATTILALAVKHNCPCLKEACFEFLSSKRALFDVIETEEFD